MDVLMNKLEVYDIAHFDLRKGHVCLKGTRVSLRNDIESWLGDNSAPNILWLHGKAGSGKTTVSNTLVAMAQRRKLLTSCFFSQRDDEYRSNTSKVLPALSFRFAEQIDAYRDALLGLIRTGFDGVVTTGTVDIPVQLERLFTNLLATLQSLDAFQLPYVIVIDALDELKDTGRQDLIMSLLELASAAPWVKIFLTSRDDSAISTILTNSDNVMPIDMNTLTQVDADIERYIRSHEVFPHLMLPAHDVGSLVRRSQGLFIWCTTLFEFLRVAQNDGLDPAIFLASVLKGAEQKDAFSSLYCLYDQAIAASTTTSVAKRILHAVLAVISLTSSNLPLSPEAIAIFLEGFDFANGCDLAFVQNAVKKLHAVMFIDVYTKAIRAHHSSFYDFLRLRTTEDCAGWPTINSIRTHISRRCLTIMHKELRFNICGIDKPILNKHIPDLCQRIHHHMSEALRYSTLYWARHLSQDDSTDHHLQQSISVLLTTEKLLFWLECLSLQGGLLEGVLAFERVGHIFEVRYFCTFAHWYLLM